MDKPVLISACHHVATLKEIMDAHGTCPTRGCEANGMRTQSLHAVAMVLQRLLEGELPEADPALDSSLIGHVKAELESMGTRAEPTRVAQALTKFFNQPSRP